MRGPDWMFALCFCFLYGSDIISCSCLKRLSLNSESATFDCVGVATSWSLNGVQLTTGMARKYELAGTLLTVDNIVGSDEGNYSCMRNDGTFYQAGCLTIYGDASFSDSNVDIEVSAVATITFDLTLRFMGAGPSENNQQVCNYCLKSSGSCIIYCDGEGSNCDISDTDSDHWWTVEQGPMFILHQAKSTDRGSYFVQVEVKHPRDSSTDYITKSFHVTSRECNMYPTINDGSVSVLESQTFINGSQANYSCNTGCILQGSNSLRCSIRSVNNVIVMDWVNETTGDMDTPSCLCPTSVLSNLLPIVSTTTEVSNTSASNSSTSASSITSSRSTTKEESVSHTKTITISTPSDMKSLDSVQPAVIVVPIIIVIILVGVIISTSIFLLIWLRSRKTLHTSMKKPMEPMEPNEIEARSDSDHDDNQSARIDDSPENRSQSSQTYGYDDTFSYNEPVIELDPETNSMEGNI